MISKELDWQIRILDIMPDKIKLSQSDLKIKLELFLELYFEELNNVNIIEFHYIYSQLIGRSRTFMGYIISRIKERFPHQDSLLLTVKYIKPHYFLGDRLFVEHLLFEKYNIDDYSLLYDIKQDVLSELMLQSEYSIIGDGFYAASEKYEMFIQKVRLEKKQINE